MQTLLTCGLACLLSASAFAQYGGGAGDGHDFVVGTLTLSAAPLNPLYGGGAGDGHDAVSGTITFSSAPLNPLYGGGAGDGHDLATGIAEFTSDALASLFGGGAGDGHDVAVGFLSIQVPLPATLLDFAASPTPAGTVRVTWTVADERDVDRYAVERSPDAGAFALVGEHPAAADNSATHAYGLTDETPLSGANYYRLRTIDVDGAEEVSDIVVVLLPAGDDTWNFAAFPNPVASSANLRLATDGLAAGEPLSLQVYDATGRLVVTQALTSTAPAEAFEVSALALPAGTYQLRLTHPSLGSRSTVLAVAH